MAPYHILIPMFFPIFPENLVLLTESEQFGPKSAHICPTNCNATAHSRNRVIDLSTESGNLFKMAAKTRVRESGYENLRLVKKNAHGGKGELDAHKKTL